MTAVLYKAWHTASAEERHDFLETVVKSLGFDGDDEGGIDFGALVSIPGRRPKAPHASAPEELVEAVRQGAAVVWLSEMIGCNERTVRRWWRGLHQPQRRHRLALQRLVKPRTG